MRRDGIEVEEPEIPDGPEIDASDEFFVTAFNDLSTERSLGDDIRPIPFSKIMDYSNLLGLTFDGAQDLAFVIRMVDNAYITKILDERKKAMKDGKSDTRGVRQKNGKNVRSNRSWS